jgi:hypothetical protein
MGLEPPMLDILYILIGLGAFVAFAGYVRVLRGL